MHAFVTTIDLSLAEKLKNDLIDQGFEIFQPPHTVFAAKKKGVSCTLFTSGKLTVQGKNKQDFILFYLEPEILKNVSFSHPETMVNTAARIGTDEAGKGDFFGPLCVAGIYAEEAGIKKLLDLRVRDSKKMSDTSVLLLASEIRPLFPHTIVRLFPIKYNELYKTFHNLNSLLAWAHSAVIEELVKNTGCKAVIIDQFAKEHVVENALKRKKLDVSLTQRHYGEEDPVVAGASLLARAAFIEGLEQLSKMVDMQLPKGANHGVIEAGKKVLKTHGKNMLTSISKLHFKTLKDVLDSE